MHNFHLAQMIAEITFHQKIQSLISFKAQWRNLSNSKSLLSRYFGKESGAQGLMLFW